MSTNHDDRPDDSDQAGRIEKLREQARQAAGEQMIAWSQVSSRRNNESNFGGASWISKTRP
jgi:hypothetical protein